MKISDVSGAIPSNSKITNDKKEEAAKEMFKSVFVEKMISEMMKTTNIIDSSSNVQKDFYMEEFSKIVAEDLVNSQNFRWKQIYEEAFKLKEETDNS